MATLDTSSNLRRNAPTLPGAASIKIVIVAPFHGTLALGLSGLQPAGCITAVNIRMVSAV